MNKALGGVILKIVHYDYEEFDEYRSGLTLDQFLDLLENKVEEGDYVDMVGAVKNTVLESHFFNVTQTDLEQFDKIYNAKLNEYETNEEAHQ